MVADPPPAPPNGIERFFYLPLLDFVFLFRFIYICFPLPPSRCGSDDVFYVGCRLSIWETGSLEIILSLPISLPISLRPSIVLSLRCDDDDDDVTEQG
jgi:hypothetical protein